MFDMRKIKYSSGYKYQLKEDFTIDLFFDFGIKKTIIHPYITLSQSGILTICEGYAWDGASGLTIDTKSSMRGALVHDALYQLMREDLLPSENKIFADGFLRDICICDGMFRWRANLWFEAVKDFAGFAIRNKVKIYEAP
jgi:hypothetical protein